MKGKELVIRFSATLGMWTLYKETGQPIYSSTVKSRVYAKRRELVK